MAAAESLDVRLCDRDPAPTVGRHQALRESGVDPFRASPLALLRAVGRRGMGALAYQPAQDVWGRVADGLDRARPDSRCRKRRYGISSRARTR